MSDRNLTTKEMEGPPVTLQQVLRPPQCEASCVNAKHSELYLALRVKVKPSKDTLSLGTDAVKKLRG